MSENVKHVSDVIGEWGKWQRNITFFALSISIFSAFNNLAVSFYAPDVKYYCADNDTDIGINFVSDKYYLLLFRKITIIVILNTQQNETIDGCKHGCKNWHFDKSVFTSTII